jgi:hypothetical protein
LQCDAAGRDKPEMRNWSEERFEVAGVTHGRSEEDFNIVRVGVPCVDDLSRSDHSWN